MEMANEPARMSMQRDEEPPQQPQTGREQPARSPAPEQTGSAVETGKARGELPAARPPWRTRTLPPPV
jgi:hypothetical protein